MINVERINKAVYQYVMKIQESEATESDIRELLNVYLEEFGARAILINEANREYNRLKCIIEVTNDSSYMMEGKAIPFISQFVDEAISQTKNGMETGVMVNRDTEGVTVSSSLFFLAMRGEKIDGCVVAVNSDPDYVWSEEKKQLLQGLGRIMRRFIIQSRLESVEIEQTKIAQSLNARINIISSISQEYFLIYYLDMNTKEYILLNHENDDTISDLPWEKAKDGSAFNSLVDAYVKKEFRDSMLEFVCMDSLNERLKDKNSIALQFESAHSGWMEGSFITAKRDENGKLLNVIFALRKIDEQKQRELAQAASLNEVKEVLATAGMGTWHIELFENERPRMIADEKMMLLLGIYGQLLTPEETYDAWFGNIDETAVQSVLDSVETMKRGLKDENTYLWNHPVFGPRYVRCGGTSLRIEGKGYILRGYHYDVTDLVERDRKQQEDLANALDAAQKANISKSTFLFNMSHDIRTPMNAIMGYANLLEKSIGNIEKQKTYIDNIQTSGGYLLSLINNVLEMARIESGNVVLDEEPLDIMEFAEDISVVFEGEYRNHGLTVNRYFNIDQPYVYCDKTKCYEIFLNLISNSIKYTPMGGSIDISLYQTERDDDRINCTIVVADTGIGMSKQFIPHIFDSFSREKTVTENKIVGTGLGMGIVKHYVDIMNGEISVDSDLGAGTTIKITLPLRIADKPKKKIKHIDLDTESEKFKGKRILIAEDNELNAEIAMEILTDAGFMVEHAEDGVVCVGMLQKAPADYYDLILMDVQMPIMNGYKTTELIRKMNNPVKANIPIFALTANVFDEDKQNAIMAGMNGHISKPIDIQKLIDTIADCFGNE